MPDKAKADPTIYDATALEEARKTRIVEAEERARRHREGVIAAVEHHARERREKSERLAEQARQRAKLKASEADTRVPETILRATQYIDPASGRPVPIADLPRRAVDVQQRDGTFLFVHLECGPKRRHGGGLVLDGSAAIQRKLVERSFAESVIVAADEAKIHPALAKAKYSAQHGSEWLTVADVVERTKSIEEHGGACRDCLARVRARPYGCFVRLDYPIVARAEEWLMDRTALGGRLGADWCVDMVRAHGLTGRPIAKLRRQGLFEAKRASSRVIRKGWLLNTSLNADQVFHGLLLGGLDFLDPANCFGMVLWFGAVELDGVSCADATEADLSRVVAARTPTERLAKTRFDVGPPSDDRAIRSMQDALHALYLAWVNDAKVVAAV